MINNKNKNNNKRRYQQGMTLIELMISMMVGLFLLAGLATIFISTKNSERTRNAVSEMDANASFVFEVMRNSITHAGYISIDPVIQGVSGFHTSGKVEAAVCRDNDPREIDNTRLSIGVTKDLGYKDIITVISLADNPCRDGDLSCPNQDDVNPQALVYSDCTGGGVARDAHVVACSTDPLLGMTERSEAKIYSSFRLIRNISSSEDRTLYCDGSRGGTQPIADNVEAIQYLYGVRGANDNIEFQRANLVSSWDSVRSVQVALLMRSSEDNILKADSDKTFYSLLDKKVNIISSDLRRLFRVYTTTINLENMN